MSENPTIVRGGYQRSRGGDPVATFVAIALAVGMLGAFAFMNPHFVHKQKREPVVVAMLELPDDPPPQETPPPPPDATPPPQAVIAAPVPVVQTIERPVIQAPAVAAPAPLPTPPRPAPPVAVAPRGPENAGELSARMISKTMPKVPLESRRAHEEGVVVLSVLLSIDGRVADVSIARSSGSPRLDRAALEAVRDWRWSPLIRDGAPVMVRGVVTIPFMARRGGPDGHGRGGGRDRDDHHRGDGPDHDDPDGGPGGGFDRS